MKSDVFISYSSVDKHVADAVCANLESSGIRCWIAPRDIFPGSDWAQSIIDAIKGSKLMVLIFSKNSNGSSQVTKELNLAVSHNLMVVPFKIDDSVPSGSMEYFLADMHWLDAIDGDMQLQIDKLKDVIKSVLPHNMKSDDISGDGKKVIPPVIPIVNPTVNIQNDAPRGPAPQTQAPSGNVGPVKAYINMWYNCFNFKGRVSRGEFWMASITSFVVGVLVSLIYFYLIGIADYYWIDGLATAMLISFAILAIPTISLAVRRLHDSNHRGWWYLLTFTGYGSIALFIFYLLKGVDQGNRFGK